MKKASRSKTKLNCKEGNTQCGGKCQPKRYKCPSAKSAKVSSAIDKLISLLDEAQKLEFLNDYFADTPIFEQNEGIFKTQAGVAGMQAYFSGDYPLINRVLYDKEYAQEADQDIKFKAMAAIIGFEEMERKDDDYIKERYAAKGVEYDGINLYRGMSFGSYDSFGKYIEELEAERDEIEFKSFTSSTLASPEKNSLDGGWEHKSVQIVIKKKKGEECAAKWVDERKRSKDEGEFLYPPGSKFRVVELEKETQERLPERLNKPLQKLWVSREDGGGPENLSMKDILGDLGPEAIMDNPEYAAFKAVLRKRKLPPMETWPDLLLKDVFSMAGLKGGRFAVMGLIVSALSNQVKPEEKTGLFDVVSAKIVLEEL